MKRDLTFVVKGNRLKKGRSGRSGRTGRSCT